MRAPSGGAKDTEPPKLILAEPKNSTIGFKGGKIKLRFSEYLDETSVDKAIKIFPRLKEGFDVDYYGKELVLDITGELATNQTYVITIDRELKDEHGVALNTPLSLAYSTGNKIDNGQISGVVYDEIDAVVHLWKINETINDSVYFTEPDYIVDVTEFGEYEFKYLSAGDYNILAVGKEGSGHPLDTKRMRYGMYWENKISINAENSTAIVNFRLRKEDPKLMLLRGELVESNWGRLVFNRPLPIDISSAKIFYVDKNGLNVPLQHFTDPMDSESIVIFSTNNLTGDNVNIKAEQVELQGNIILDPCSVKVSIPTLIDSSALEIISPGKSVKIIPEQDNKPVLSIVFSKPIISDWMFNNGSMFLDDSINVNFEMSKVNPMQIDINPEEGWKANSKYKFVLVSNTADSVFTNTFADSLISIDISTTDAVSYGGLTINIEGITSRYAAELKSLNNQELNFISVVNSVIGFEYNNIPKGEYKLMIFEDIDKNKKYTFGTANPYRLPEPFFVFEDTLEVRTNWDVEYFLDLNEGTK